MRTSYRENTRARNRPMHGRYLVPLLSLGVALAALSTPGYALRHLRLMRSYPAADTVLASSPDAVRLWLSESAELPVTRLTLTDAKGAAVALSRVSHASAKDAPLVATLVKPVGPGTYNVSWRTMSRDGHMAKGAFAFRVAARAR